MNQGGLAVAGEVSSPEGLLRRIFDNLIQDELRRHRRHENKHDPPDEDLDADERSGRPLVSEGPAPDAPLDQRRAISAVVQHALDLKPNYRIGVLMVHLPEQIVPPHLYEMGPATSTPTPTWPGPACTPPAPSTTTIPSAAPRAPSSCGAAITPI